MQRVAIGAACAAAVAFGLFCSYGLAARFVLHGPVEDGSLAKSVRLHADDSMGMLVNGACRPTGTQTWRCTLTDYDVGGHATYRVARRGDTSCWTAELVPASTQYGPLPQTLSGCVHEWQWELVDLVGGPDYPDSATG